MISLLTLKTSCHQTANLKKWKIGFDKKRRKMLMNTRKRNFENVIINKKCKWKPRGIKNQKPLPPMIIYYEKISFGNERIEYQQTFRNINRWKWKSVSLSPLKALRALPAEISLTVYRWSRVNYLATAKKHVVDMYRTSCLEIRVSRRSLGGWRLRLALVRLSRVEIGLWWPALVTRFVCNRAPMLLLRSSAFSRARLFLAEVLGNKRFSVAQRVRCRGFWKRFALLRCPGSGHSNFSTRFLSNGFKVQYGSMIYLGMYHLQLYHSKIIKIKKFARATRFHESLIFT